LQAALKLEVFEHTQMYPGFARTARDEGFDEVAEWFEVLIRAERSHTEHLACALETLIAGPLE
jgi:rubrerythrin